MFMFVYESIRVWEQATKRTASQYCVRAHFKDFQIALDCYKRFFFHHLILFVPNKKIII